jgi:hypothetical protein
MRSTASTSSSRTWRQKVGQSGRPVVITHHVDVARYSVPDEDPGRPVKNEWGHGDVAAYHEALKGYHVAGIFYGHTMCGVFSHGTGGPPAKPGTVRRSRPVVTFLFSTQRKLPTLLAPRRGSFTSCSRMGS